MGILVFIFSGLAIIAGLVSFVCTILVIVKMFQKAGAGLGIVGIITCGIGAFIWGWIKARELALTKLMFVWTAAIVVSTVSNIAAMGLGASLAANNPEIQKAWKEGIENAQKAAEEAQKAAEEAAKTPATPQQ